MLTSTASGETVIHPEDLEKMVFSVLHRARRIEPALIATSGYGNRYDPDAATYMTCLLMLLVEMAQDFSVFHVIVKLETMEVIGEYRGKGKS